MRRSIVGLFAVFLALTLLAAAPGPQALAAAPGSQALAAAPAASILGTPVLIVYPFSVSGDITKEAGSRLAITIATQIANLGGVDVKPATPGIERRGYLEAAHGGGADYYIAGYVTPLGDGVSVVEQLVSTLTGIVVYSNTAQIRTFEDAAGQGDVLRDALLRHQSRNLGAYAAQPPPANTPSPTPAPGSATQANLGRLFGRKQKRGAQPVVTPAPALAQTTNTPAPSAPAIQPAPASAMHPAPLSSGQPAQGSAGQPAPVSAGQPAPVPAASPAAVAAVQRGSGYGILAIGGPAEDDRRSFTSAALRNDMIANHRQVTNAGGTPQAACGDASVGTLLGGNLTTRSHTILGQPQATATLELLAYDCAGNVVYRKTFAHDARGDWKTAVDGVVARAVATFLREPGGSPRS